MVHVGLQTMIDRQLTHAFNNSIDANTMSSVAVLLFAPVVGVLLVSFVTLLSVSRLKRSSEIFAGQRIIR
jgi:hypothetical protein